MSHELFMPHLNSSLLLVPLVSLICFFFNSTIEHSQISHQSMLKNWAGEMAKSQTVAIWWARSWFHSLGRRVITRGIWGSKFGGA
jgi:hypothetical protein